MVVCHSHGDMLHHVPSQQISFTDFLVLAQNEEFCIQSCFCNVVRLVLLYVWSCCACGPLVRVVLLYVWSSCAFGCPLVRVVLLYVWSSCMCGPVVCVVLLYVWSCCRILDVWDICRPALIALDFDVKIGDVQPSCGRWTESQIECVVNEDLFPSKDSYQIHINSDRVCHI